MTLKQEKKEHKEHQKALKPLMKHLKQDELKLGKQSIKIQTAKSKMDDMRAKKK